MGDGPRRREVLTDDGERSRRGRRAREQHTCSYDKEDELGGGRETTMRECMLGDG